MSLLPHRSGGICSLSNKIRQIKDKFPGSLGIRGITVLHFRRHIIPRHSSANQTCLPRDQRVRGRKIVDSGQLEPKSISR